MILLNYFIRTQYRNVCASRVSVYHSSHTSRNDSHYELLDEHCHFDRRIRWKSRFKLEMLICNQRPVSVIPGTQSKGPVSVMSHW
jgi:hypothetical protein